MSHRGHPPPPPKPPDGWKNSLNEAGATGADVTKTFVTALRDSADAPLPLKSLAAGILAVCQTAERARRSKQRAKDLTQRCCSLVKIMADAVNHPNDVPPELNVVLQVSNFEILLEDIQRTLKPLQKRIMFRRKRDRNELDDLNRRLDEAYHIMTSVTIQRDVAKTQAGPYRLAERPLPGSRMSHRGHPPPPPKPPDGWKSSLNEAAATCADVTKTFVTAIRDVADALPPLKSLAAGVLTIWQTAERASRSKQRAEDLDERCDSLLKMIADALVKGPTEMNVNLENYKILLEDIQRTLNPLRTQSRLKSFARLNRDQDELDDLNRLLGEAYQSFTISNALMTQLQLERIEREGANQRITLGHIVRGQIHLKYILTISVGLF